MTFFHNFYRYATQTDTASAGNDFITTAGNVTFIPGGSKMLNVQINIIDDDAVEATEQFRVILQLRDTENTAIGNIRETTVTIDDNDS